MARQAVAPKIEATIAEPTPRPAFRRFALPDVPTMGAWLLWRLKERYPHVQEKNVAGWLRGAIEGNETLFIRSERACAMAQVKYHELNPQPYVEEVFVLTMGRESDGNIEDAHREEAAYAYLEFKRWAEAMGASEIIVDRCSDVAREHMQEMLGKLYMRETVFAKVRK
jgi:hypothetical protein